MSFITSLKIEAALDSTYGKGLDLALSGGVFDCKETPSSPLHRRHLQAGRTACRPRASTVPCGSGIP